MKNGESEMSIWQNHEQRITTLEVTISGLTTKMDSVERTVRDGNEKAEKKLDTIDQRLMDEFFHKKRTNHNNSWALALKIGGGLLGGGGIIYALYDIISKTIIGG